MSDRVRLQLDIEPLTLERLDATAEATGCSTRSELVRRAVEVYDYLVTAHVERGAIVVVEEADGRRAELVVGGIRRRS